MDLTPLAARSLSGLLEQVTGQQLASARRWRLETALHPVMKDHNIHSLDMLAAMVAQNGSATLREAVVEALLNHETSFYRDLAVFKAIAGDVLPAMAGSRSDARRLRIWSAGCSTGQEPYSLGLLLAAQETQWAGWSIDILGSDVSPQAVQQARQGLYSQMEIQRGLPITELLARFDQDGEHWRIRPQGQARLGFMVHNLLDAPPPGRFDMILCRNVLLYFSAERKRQVLDRLASAIAPDGVLVLGAGETVMGHTEAFEPHPDLRGMYRPARQGWR
ncbi:CheR family methyltransferase [uncultured Sphingomonas sp.]|uniref:CheR family methyltransferase n=1 Tax=uncultured Sphingomonas sp. TaxID=158754 RepID=UPI0025F529F0|nr:CheR family methyltransferase [uncultured Sphingomonas sp.]